MTTKKSWVVWTILCNDCGSVVRYTEGDHDPIEKMPVFPSQVLAEMALSEFEDCRVGQVRIEVI